MTKIKPSTGVKSQRKRERNALRVYIASGRSTAAPRKLARRPQRILYFPWQISARKSRAGLIYVSFAPSRAPIMREWSRDQPVREAGADSALQPITRTMIQRAYDLLTGGKGRRSITIPRGE